MKGGTLASCFLCESSCVHTVVPSPAAIAINERKAPLVNDLYLNPGHFPGGNHAFDRKSYHIQWSGASVGAQLVVASKVSQGSWLALHGGGGAEHRLARRGT